MKVVLVNTCNQWKERSSMHLAGVIEEKDLPKVLFEMLKNKVIEVNAIDIYADEDEQVIDEDVLLDYLENTPINALNSGIDYLYIHECTIGEIETDGGYLY